jgi:ligand-binding SRPBCC domain-containing protein
MGLIQLETFISAPLERCFDLSLSVFLHLESAVETGERVISGRERGLFVDGDEVTWEALHLGIRKRLSVEITSVDRPRHFRDKMTRGPFRYMRHDHRFEPHGGGTLMVDAFEVAMFPVFDALVLLPHLRRFLVTRNATIKRVAEGDDWARFLNE